MIWLKTNDGGIATGKGIDDINLFSTVDCTELGVDILILYARSLHSVSLPDLLKWSPCFVRCLKFK